MTAQPPLPLVPDGARPVGAAAAIVEDDDGGRVYVAGNLAYAWDAGDAAGRRFAAVSLTRIKVATQLQGAAAFTVNPATLRRWETRCGDAGVAGLLTERKGPKRKSKLTPDTVAAIRRMRTGGASYRTVAATVGVSLGSVHNALRPIHTGADPDSDEPCAPTGSDNPLPQEREPEVEVGQSLRSMRVPRMVVRRRLSLSWRHRRFRRRWCWPIRRRGRASGCWRGSGGSPVRRRCSPRGRGHRWRGWR
jgi:hypothetical protein